MTSTGVSTHGDEPEVSVILPVYNGEATLAASIRSLLAQSHDSFEIIIIDDGSTDGSAAVIAGFGDPRIRHYSQPNQGLAATLNRGLSLSRGRYVARLDADDLALPGRLGKQVAFLEAHPEVALLGTWAQIYRGDEPSKRFHRHPGTSDTLKLELLLDNPFVHSSVMMRAGIVRELGGYRVEAAKGLPEDYELWSRIAEKHEVANLPEVLTIYREVPGSITRTASAAIAANVVSISARNLCALLQGRHDDDACRSFASLYHGIQPPGLPLSRTRALALWRDAAESLGGPPKSWPSEFRASYVRTLRQLRSRLARRGIPPGAIEVLRGVRNWLRA